MKIGFIGLGTMGGEMAMQLAKAGHAMVVHDVRREAAARHLAEGAPDRLAATDRYHPLNRSHHLQAGPARRTFDV